MWIIPSNHPLYSQHAQGCVGSKKELIEFSAELEQSLMWKSKPLSVKIWSNKWNRVYWLPHLFGRILKPSHGRLFTESYTGSLADIPVSRSPMLDFEKVQTILDTFGRTLRVALKNRGLWAFGSKMSRDTYRLAFGTYLRTYENWVIKLRSDYSVRQKSELPIEGTGFLFSGWKTPSSSECEGGVMSKGKIGDAKYKLRDQVSWPTPMTQDFGGSTSKEFSPKLSEVVWPTPTAMNRVRDEETMQKCADFRKKNANQNTVPLYLEEVVLKNWGTPRSSMLGHEPGKMEKSNLEDQVYGPLVQENHNIPGKRLGLNPAWVMQLMGTTIEKTFFAWREMPLSNSKPK